MDPAQAAQVRQGRDLPEYPDPGRRGPDGQQPAAWSPYPASTAVDPSQWSQPGFPPQPRQPGRKPDDFGQVNKALTIAGLVGLVVGWALVLPYASMAFLSSTICGSICDEAERYRSGLFLSLAVGVPVSIVVALGGLIWRRWSCLFAMAAASVVSVTGVVIVMLPDLLGSGS
ncbi:MAG: hypothetical protein QM658_02770 [Gordonia sp. (in: high G+C Gram-positive bacteria)]